MTTNGFYTTIDLSQLPAPTILDNLGFDAIFALWQKQFLELMPGYTGLAVESDPVVKVLQVGAYRELALRQLYIDQVKAVLLAYAPLDVLVHLGAAWGVTLLDGESTESFRARIQMAPEALSTAGPEGAYTVVAKSASAQVKDVRVLSPTPGTVHLVILSTDGDGTPSDALLATVLEALSAEDVRPMTDSVSVYAAQVIHYTVDAVLAIYGGVDQETVRKAAVAQCEAYCTASHALGLGVTESGLKASLTVNGVHSVTLVSPASGITCTGRQAAWCAGVTATTKTFEVS